MKQSDVVIAEYLYDAFGRRVKKSVSGAVTHFHYDIEGNLISETAGGGSPLRDYVYQNGNLLAIKLYGDHAGIYYVICDHLGTPQLIVNTSGTVVWKAAYQSFGKAQILIETITCNIRFKGQYFDAETGLHYNWHRFYNPKTGNYLTPDPIGLEGGINLWTYVQNNPVNYIDPWGESKTKGIKSGNDEFLTRLRKARGNRNTINKIAKEAEDLKKAGKIKPQRWKKIRAWLKLAKDGRLYMGGIPIGLSTFDVWCTKNPIQCMELTGGECE